MITNISLARIPAFTTEVIQAKIQYHYSIKQWQTIDYQSATKIFEICLRSWTQIFLFEQIKTQKRICISTFILIIVGSLLSSICALLLLYFQNIKRVQFVAVNNLSSIIENSVSIWIFWLRILKFLISKFIGRDLRHLRYINQVV